VGDDIKQAVDDVLREMPTRELVERTVAATEARIVAWLRREADGYQANALPQWAWAYRRAAASIEKRQHEETAGG
jgi:hypothetical protein